MLYFVIRETKLEKRVIQTYSTKNNPCQKYPQKTWVMRKINQYYLDNFNCTIIFIKDGLNMSSNSEYCNISLHVHFQKHYDQMYNDNLVDCPSAQSCTNIDYRLHSRGAGLRPAPRSLYKVLAGSGTRCDKVWYKMWQGLVLGTTGLGTRCDKVCYRVWQELVQGMTKSGTRCDRVW